MKYIGKKPIVLVVNGASYSFALGDVIPLELESYFLRHHPNQIEKDENFLREISSFDTNPAGMFLSELASGIRALGNHLETLITCFVTSASEAKSECRCENGMMTWKDIGAHVSLTDVGDGILSRLDLPIGIPVRYKYSDSWRYGQLVEKFSGGFRLRGAPLPSSFEAFEIGDPRSIWWRRIEIPPGSTTFSFYWRGSDAYFLGADGYSETGSTRVDIEIETSGLSHRVFTEDFSFHVGNDMWLSSRLDIDPVASCVKFGSLITVKSYEISEASLLIDMTFVICPVVGTGES